MAVRNHRIQAGQGPALAMLVLGMVVAQASVTSAQEGWSGSIATLSAPMSSTAGTPDIAVDPEGNVIAVWLQHAGSTFHVVQTARFVRATGTLTAPSNLSLPGEFTSSAQVAVDDGGNGVAIWARGGVVQTTRYSAASNTWSAPVDLSVPGQTADTPRVAMDAAGNTAAVWTVGFPMSPQVVQAIYYTASATSWGSIVPLTSATSLPAPRVAVDSARHAVVAFIVNGVVYARRYAPLSNHWSSAVPISATGQTAAGFLELAVDGAGNAIAVWLRFGAMWSFGVVQAARYVRASDAWTAPTDLSAEDCTSPQLALNGTGNAHVTWVRRGGRLMDVESAAYSVISDSWSPAVSLSVGFNYYTGAPVAVDRGGNAIATWINADGGPSLQASRYVAATGSWSQPENIASTPGLNAAVRFDTAGNAVSLWVGSESSGIRVQATRWIATPAAPTITGIRPGSGSLAIDFVAPPSREASFAASNYAYSLDNGVTWTTRDPVSTASPLLIGGLVNFTTHVVRLRAINSAGPGRPSAAITSTVGPAPDPPTGLMATSVAGSVVAIAWTPPSGGVAFTGFVLEGGLHPAEVVASIPTGSTAPMFTFVAPSGAFYIRVHALAATVKSGPSNEVRIFVNAAVRPSAPANLLGLVNGTSLSLSWTNTFEGGTPTSLWLVVAGSMTASFPLPLGEAFTYPDVPPGTYTLRVVAANSIGLSPPSNPVTLSFPGTCSGVPDAPTKFQAWRNGSAIETSWRPPESGPAVESYTVLVGGAYVGTFATTGRSLSGAAPAGSYTLSVAARNACGTGPPTPARTVVIP